MVVLMAVPHKQPIGEDGIGFYRPPCPGFGPEANGGRQKRRTLVAQMAYSSMVAGITAIVIWAVILVATALAYWTSVQLAPMD
jgi:hypothetical protein